MSLKVSSIHKRFGGSYISKKNNAEDREVIVSSLTRLGMELNGVFHHKAIDACIVWGNQESQFLSSLSEEKRKEVLRKILEKNPPVFLISNLFSNEEILKNMNEQVNGGRSIIIKYPYSTTEIFNLIGTWLSKTLATWTTIHATVINIFGVGALIIGEPGIGKSELALELIKMNHLFLGDDAIDITRVGNTIIAKAHSIANDFIQVRGLGILNVKEMYGSTKIIDETNIGVVFELRHADNSMVLQRDFENLGDQTLYKKYLDVDLPQYILPVTQGRNMSGIIELAMIDYKMKKKGYNSAKKFDESLKKFLVKK